jgi:hypothetical protein
MFKNIIQYKIILVQVAVYMVQIPMEFPPNPTEIYFREFNEFML